jgi:hypothetical protein
MLLKRLMFILAALLIAAPLRGADLDANLPADTEVIVSINLEQLLASPLGKRYLQTTVAEAIKSNPQAQEALKLAELDPLRDLTRITIAFSSIGSDSGFVVVGGKFNKTKLAELAEKLAAEQKEKLKIHKSGGATIYEIAGERPMFATVANDSTILLSTDREQFTKLGKPRKELADLTQKADGKQTAWLAALPGVTAVAPATDDAQRKALEKVVGILGVLRVQASAKLELTLLTQDAAAAQAIEKIMADFISVAKVFGRDAVKENPALAPLVEVIAGITASATDKSVLLTTEMSAAQIEKAVKQLGAEK